MKYILLEYLKAFPVYVVFGAIYALWDPFGSGAPAAWLFMATILGATFWLTVWIIARTIWLTYKRRKEKKEQNNG